MRPSTSPSLTMRSRPAKACTPPKRLERPRVSSSVMTSSTEEPGQTRIRALGEEQHDGDQQQAVRDEMRAVPAPLCEIVARQLGERAQDERAEDRAEYRAGAADDGADDDLDGQRNAEH